VTTHSSCSYETLAGSEAAAEARARLSAGELRIELGANYVITVDSELEGEETGYGQRPDVVVKDKARLLAWLVDVTVTTEGAPECFDSAREAKKAKYARLARRLRDSGYRSRWTRSWRARWGRGTPGMWTS
jgi:hypothetical protein